MSGSGRVNDVFLASTLDTDTPAQKVVVDRDDGTQIAFFIPIGPAPAAGAPITWGPRHAEWPGQRVRKMSWEMKP